MRYKVGDKVRVRKDLSCGKDYGGMKVHYYMERWSDRFITIKEVFDDKYAIEEDDYDWNDAMLEPVEEPKFKVGDRVRYLGSNIKLKNKFGTIHGFRFNEVIIVFEDVVDGCMWTFKDVGELELVKHIEEPITIDGYDIETLRRIARVLKDTDLSPLTISYYLKNDEESYHRGYYEGITAFKKAIDETLTEIKKL